MDEESFADSLPAWLDEDVSPVGNGPLVVCGSAGLGEQELARLTTLRGAVRIGVDRTGGTPEGLAGGFDVMLTVRPDPPREWVSVGPAAIDDAVDTLRRQVAAFPLAASILCQTLRLGADLPFRDALILESLAYSTLLGGDAFARWRARTPQEAVAVVAGSAVAIDRDGDLLRIAIDRPETLNAITAAVRDDLVEALRLARADPSIARVELSGRGRAFSIGGAIEEFGAQSDAGLAHAIRTARSVAAEIDALGARLTVAAHGACIGAGVEMMAAARHVVARRNAFFQLPELGMGLIPGAGGTVTVARRIGRWRTAWMALTGHRVAASQALEWGLVDRVE